MDGLNAFFMFLMHNVTMGWVIRTGYYTSLDTSLMVLNKVIAQTTDYIPRTDIAAFIT